MECAPETALGEFLEELAGPLGVFHGAHQVSLGRPAVAIQELPPGRRHRVRRPVARLDHDRPRGRDRVQELVLLASVHRNSSLETGLSIACGHLADPDLLTTSRAAEAVDLWLPHRAIAPRHFLYGRRDRSREFFAGTVPVPVGGDGGIHPHDNAPNRGGEGRALSGDVPCLPHGPSRTQPRNRLVVRVTGFEGRVDARGTTGVRGAVRCDRSFPDRPRRKQTRSSAPSAPRGSCPSLAPSAGCRSASTCPTRRPRGGWWGHARAVWRGGPRPSTSSSGRRTGRKS